MKPTLALILLLFMVPITGCRKDQPPQIILCIGDGFGGALCDIPGETAKVFWPPSKLENAWITTQADANRLLSWCLRSTPEESQAILQRAASGESSNSEVSPPQK